LFEFRVCHISGAWHFSLNDKLGHFMPSLTKMLARREPCYNTRLWRCFGAFSFLIRGSEAVVVLKSVQKALKDKYRQDPSASRITLKAKGGHTETPVACSVAIGR